MCGLLMSLKIPFHIKSVPDSKQEVVMKETVGLVKAPHEKYRLAHDDLKPLNMLRYRDSHLRFCDCEFARPINEDPGCGKGVL